MSLGFISHSDVGFHDNGWNHPEHVGRIRAVTRALRNAPELFMELDHIEGRHATEDELAMAHDRTYIGRVRDLSAAGGGRFDADTVASEGTWGAATAAAGSVLEAVDRALDGRNVRSFVAVRPPGHHALRDHAMGFCLFGSVALGALHAQKAGARKVLIVDWDVHHGNGTQALVEGNDDIHFVSMHQWPWYPGSGAAEDRGPLETVWNVPLPPGLRAAQYRDALLKAVDQATTDWTPDLVMISAGFDSLAGDPLGGFTLELDDVRDLTREMVRRAGDWCHGRIVSALEGGYEPDRVGAAVVAHLETLR